MAPDRRDTDVAPKAREDDVELDRLLDLALPAAVPPGAEARLARAVRPPSQPRQGRFPWAPLLAFLFALGVAGASDLRHPAPPPAARREGWSERVAPALPPAEQPVLVSAPLPTFPRLHVAQEPPR